MAVCVWLLVVLVLMVWIEEYSRCHYCHFVFQMQDFYHCSHLPHISFWVIYKPCRVSSLFLLLLIVSVYPTSLPLYIYSPNPEDKALIFTDMLNQDRGFMSSRDASHPLLHPLSSRRSPPSLLLFLLASLAFPLAVLQHGGSIWKCFLKGSGGRCS